MATGSNRRVMWENEKTWGAIFGKAVAAYSIGATSVVLDNPGGSARGVNDVVAGMYLYFDDGTTEAPKLISNPVVAGQQVTVTVPALTANHLIKAKAFISYAPNKPLIFSKFSAGVNPNRWSDPTYNGTAAGNVRRKNGLYEVAGSLEYALRPTSNLLMTVRAFGKTQWVTGTVPGSPVNGTLSAAVTTIGALTVTSASAAVIGDIMQIDTGVNAEVRKITNKVSTTFTFDYPLEKTHASGVAFNKVVAPYLRYVPGRTGNLRGVVFEDYRPVDYDANPDGSGLTSDSFLITGAVMNKFSLETSEDAQAAKIKIDFEAQAMKMIQASTAQAIPDEDVFTFDQTSVLVAGGRHFNATKVKIDVDNKVDPIKALHGQKYRYGLKAGLQEVTGELELYEDEATKDEFYGYLESGSVVALQVKILDDATGLYAQFDCPKISFDAYNDDDFDPSSQMYGKSKFTAELDTATNSQITLTLLSNEYLP